ncbi:hypothetical protein DB88DRAFT_510324 [Papiliotrema laurentii]|uniref:Uncharacterized protein n=1 Tax=Papiliotrema laurentii TaxID=5418 RepID=A0AAD9D0T7_PAPLA|nr:hypothetical protein DB88DRAFT_510324 [Papiliotrema laurentii]
MVSSTEPSVQETNPAKSDHQETKHIPQLQWEVDPEEVPGGQVKVTRSLTEFTPDTLITESTPISGTTQHPGSLDSGKSSSLYDQAVAKNPLVRPPLSWDQLGFQPCNGSQFVWRRGSNLPGLTHKTDAAVTYIFSPVFSILMEKEDKVIYGADVRWFWENPKGEWTQVRDPKNSSLLNSVAGLGMNMSLSLNRELAHKVSQYLSQPEGPDWKGAYDFLAQTAAEHASTGALPRSWKPAKSVWTSEVEISNTSSVDVTPTPPPSSPPEST